VYLYFDNDAKVRAPFDGISLVSRVDKILRSKSGTRSWSGTTD